ncbi:MAG: sporulation integral membrane protein YtvI [Eubacteriales bacterium]|nr:sporulation integral membrane protein YtvI [Eubacteriales bacterium]
MTLKTEGKRKFIIDVLFVVVLLLLVYVGIKYVMVWFLPFVIGLVVAVCLQKPVAWLVKKTKINRTFWSLLLVLTVLCAIFAAIGLVGWQLSKEIPGFLVWIKSLVPNVKNTFATVTAWVSSVSDRLPFDLTETIGNLPGTIIDAAVSGVTGLATSMGKTVIVDGPGLLIACIFSIVASCYITKDYNKITNFVLLQLNDKNKELVINVKRLFVTNILYMLRGYALILFITFIELLIGLSILRVEYAPILAALIAVLDILPVVGTGTVLIPWGIVSLILGDFRQGIGVLIVYVLITIIRNIIEPRIIGDQVGLHPIVTLVSMYVGLKIFGVVGMMLMPVMMIILVKLHESGIIHIWNMPLKPDANESLPLIHRIVTAKKKKKNQTAEKE